MANSKEKPPKSDIKEKFKKAKKSVGSEVPDLSAIESVRTPDERIRVELEELKLKHTRLQMLFEGAQGYIGELKQENQEYKQAAKEGKELASTDALTGLLNLRGFEEKAKILLNAAPLPRNADAKKTGPEISFNVVFIDLNEFKAINDTYGHKAGDEALKEVAQALKSAVRDGDLVGRKGGDEFVIAFLSSEDLSKGIIGQNQFIIGERIRRKLQDTGFELDGQKVPPMTASIGVAKARPEDEKEGLNAVIHRADTKVYEAKAEKEKAKEEGKPPQSYLSVEGLEGVV